MGRTLSVKAFIDADTDGSGTLTREELSVALHAHSCMSEASVLALFYACDTRGDGAVTMLEFLHGMRTAQRQHVGVVRLQSAVRRWVAARQGTTKHLKTNMEAASSDTSPVLPELDEEHGLLSQQPTAPAETEAQSSWRRNKATALEA